MDPRGTARRPLLRAAVWTLPVVALGAAAPALAASADLPAHLVFDTVNTFGGAYNSAGKPTTLMTQVQVRNAYYAAYPSVSASVQTLTLVIRFDAAQVTAAAPTSVSGTGWSFVNVATSGGSRVFTFKWTGTLDPGGPATALLAFQVALSNTNPGVRGLTATASATNATDANGTASYTVP